MKIKQILLLVLGCFALALGAVGLFLPVLPTTPFVLVAAACFSGSHTRLYNRIVKTKYFGQYIENYKNKTGVAKAVKVNSLVFLWIMLTISAILFMKTIPILIFLVVGIAVSAHILSIKSR